MKIHASDKKRPLAAKLRRAKEQPERMTVGGYLLKRLEKLGTRHIFGSSEKNLLRFIKRIEYHPTIQFL